MMAFMGEKWDSFNFRSSQLFDRVVNEIVPDLLVSSFVKYNNNNDMI